MIDWFVEIIVKFLVIQHMFGRSIHKSNEFMFVEWIIGEFCMCSAIWMMTLWMKFSRRLSNQMSIQNSHFIFAHLILLRQFLWILPSDIIHATYSCQVSIAGRILAIIAERKMIEF